MSGLEVALTLVHEGIHTEIYRKLLTIHGASYLSNLNFPTMFNLYQDYKLKDGFSHEYIARWYIETISTILKKIDNDRFTIEYYQALSWQGLETTDYYTGKKPSEIQTIKDLTNALLLNRSKNDCDDTTP